MDLLVFVGLLAVWGCWHFLKKYSSDPNFRDLIDREDARQRGIDADRRDEEAHRESVRNWDDHRKKRASMKYKMPKTIFDRKWKWDVEIIQNDVDELNILAFHNHGDAPHEVWVHVDFQVDGETVAEGEKVPLRIPPSTRLIWDIRNTPAFRDLSHEMSSSIAAESVRILRFEPCFIHPDKRPTMKKPVYFQAFLEAVTDGRAANPVAEAAKFTDFKLAVQSNRNERAKYLSAWGMHCLGIGVLAIVALVVTGTETWSAAQADGEEIVAVAAIVVVAVILYAVALVPSFVARLFGLSAAIWVHRITLLFLVAVSALVIVFPPA